jgi:sugar transferase EpsL
MYRLRDILIASFALMLLWPLMLLIAGLLWITQGKVLFRQMRPGYRERPFVLLKFSTLYDAKPGEPEAARIRERLTPVGKHLRRYSLDELPQLINILRGEMSLVGPRPLLMAYLPLYSAEEHRRHEVLPGLTGWAQIHGRNALTFKQRFAYDLWYVENRSFALDWHILWRTVAQVIRGRGVYVDEQTTSTPYDGSN